jgi:hypothetical protein
MTTFIPVTDSNGKVHHVPPITGEALSRYFRHTLGDVDASRFVREAKKLERMMRKLAEAGDRDAVLELVARINNAPAL